MTARFTLYPAIDLKGGRVVRLRRGDMEDATVYSDDPAGQARAFAELGFSWLHVVDLDGAFAGRPANAEAVRAILGASALPVQLGGGIRDAETAEAWLSAGIRRVILGSMAAKQPELARELCARFPGRIVIGIDARAGFVATEGWAEASAIPALDLALSFAEAGAAAIIHTDIDRDGMLGGVNQAATAEIARQARIPVIASGGVGGLEDLVALRDDSSGIAGVVIGRALYDGRVNPQAALRVAAGASGTA
jgi:phosphoribosylformimino-5-aminoimidazole carboxamide ribotide isomerase